MKKIIIIITLFMIISPVTVCAEELNIEIMIPGNYKSASAGDEILTSIRITNLAAEAREDVYLDFWVEDSSGNSMLNNRETVAVETTANFVRSFELPESLVVGDYTAHASVTDFDGKSSAASTNFSIAEKKTNLYPFYTLGMVLLISIIIYALFRSKGSFEKTKVKIKVWLMVRRRKLK